MQINVFQAEQLDKVVTLDDPNRTFRKYSLEIIDLSNTNNVS